MAAGLDDEYSFMYFGDEDDGAVKTGKQKIDIDGDEVEFEFKKDGSKKGQGRNEVDESDKVAYAMGKRYKADSDNKYEIVLELKKEEGKDVVSTGLVSMTVDEYIGLIAGDAVEKDDEKIYFEKDVTNALPTTYELNGETMDIVNEYVVNTSGSLVKSKSKCTDGDDYIIKVTSPFNIEKIYEDLD